MAGGADLILIPEQPFRFEKIYSHLEERLGDTKSPRRDRTLPRYSVIVVAEGAHAEDGGLVTVDDRQDPFGHARLGGIAVHLEREIERRTGFETRMTILGHVQRGGTPIAYDRVLGTRFGVAAVDAVTRGEFGRMVALRGTEIELVALDEALAEPKLLDPEFFETAEVFFG